MSVIITGEKRFVLLLASVDFVKQIVIITLKINDRIDITKQLITFSDYEIVLHLIIVVSWIRF